MLRTLWRPELLTLVVLTAVPSPARADLIVVDQSMTELGTVFGAINECCRYSAQTFTAGLDGTLVGVAVEVESNMMFPLTVRLTRATATGVPTLDTLAQATVPSGSSTLSDRISFDLPVRQFPGDLFAIVLSYDTAPQPGPGSGVAHWRGTLGNPYPNGSHFASVDGSSWFSDPPDVDNAFKTFVTPVPEPATGTSLLVAAALAAWRRARASKQGRAAV